MTQFQDFLQSLDEAGLNGNKSSGSQSNWDYYINGNDRWLKMPLQADKDNVLVKSDLKTTISSFSKGTPIQILSTDVLKSGSSQFQRVRVGKEEGYTRISNISKPTTVARFDKSGNNHLERQETGTINLINEAIQNNGGEPITVKGSNGVTLRAVTEARKNEGHNQYGNENYSDIIIVSSGKELGISMKIGDNPPSLFGGGRDAMYRTDPEYFKSIMNQALQQALKDGFVIGSDTELKDVFIELNNKKFILDQLKGTPEMGGPIQYMGTGGSNPEQVYHNNILEFTNINFIEIEKYARTLKPIIRIRRRQADHVFTDKIDSHGIPYFFTGQNKSSKVKGRIVTVSSASSRGLLVKPR